MQAKTKDLLKVREVAAVFMCHQRKVYQMLDKGLIPEPVRFQRFVYWPADEIDILVKGYYQGLTEDEQRELVVQLTQRRKTMAKEARESIMAQPSSLSLKVA